MKRVLFPLLFLLFIFWSIPASPAQVTLAWDQSNEAAGYKIYWGTSSNNYNWVIDVGNDLTVTLTDNQLPNGPTYYFVATAYDLFKWESDYSNEISYNTVTACSYSISPDSSYFSASGGSGTFTVATQSGCVWSASIDASWITIASGANGTGNGTVSYSVAPNVDGATRTIGSTIAGELITISQAGIQQYAIAASAGTGGMISPNGSVSVGQGENQTFSITPTTGYAIFNVIVDGVSVGTSGNYTFLNITTNHSIEASFSTSSEYDFDDLSRTSPSPPIVTNKFTGTDWLMAIFGLLIFH